MGYELKKNLLSWRFWILFLAQLAMYYFLNKPFLKLPGTFFYSHFTNSLWINIPVLALFCSGLIGMQTYDELDKDYQPLIFSRTSLSGWIKRKFTVNCMVSGIFIALAWVVLLIYRYYLAYPTVLNLFFLGNLHLYSSIISCNPLIATIQMISLDLLRAFFFGAMLGAVATLGAVMLKSRYLNLAFPAAVTILFDYYLGRAGFDKLTWNMQFTLIALARPHMGPWFSFFYLGLLCLLFLGLANHFVIKRVRYE